MIYKGLPVYEATIPNDADGMVVCSLVKNAAVESDFLAFDEDVKPLEFAVENEEQRMVLGVVMKANYLIFRHHPDFGDFYITYSPETIQKMIERFFNEHYVNSVDLEHSFQLEEGVHLVQAFIKNKEKGIDPVDFQDCEDGSLFFQYHIENDNIWNAIKEGTYAGFSLAGTFGIEETFNKQEQNNNKTISRKYMSKLGKIKEALKSLLMEFGTVTTDKGVLVWDGEDELVEGMEVRIVDSEGNENKPEDGEYATDDEKKIVVEDGKVKEIVDLRAEVSPTEDTPIEEMDDENPASEDVGSEGEPETDEKDAEIERLRARIDELEAENAQLRERIAELEKQPAAYSADEEFKKIEEQTDNTPLGKLKSRGYKVN